MLAPQRLAALALPSLSALAPGPAAARPARPPPQLHFTTEAAYYLPIHENRVVHSAFLNTLVGLAPHPKVPLSLHAGLTVTGAWGYILQHDDRGAQARHDTAASGVGPILLLRCEPLGPGPVYLSLDALLGVVLYSTDFPPGGDIYNFTVRFGGALLIRLRQGFTLSIGARWMHVSNGQGLGPHNPSYEGVGFPVGLSYLR